MWLLLLPVFSASILDPGDRRGRGSERLTAGLLRLQACLTGPCSRLVLSLAFFLFILPKSPLSPSFRCVVPVGVFFCLEYWNSLCLVLFVRHSVRIPPPTHSWLRNVLRLPSQVFAHFITSWSPTHSSFLPPSHSVHSPPLPTWLHIWSLCLIVSLFCLSARPFRDGS